MAYFLAEGSDDRLKVEFSKVEPKYGKADFGGKAIELAPILDQPLPADLVKALGKLPEAKTVINR